MIHEYTSVRPSEIVVNVPVDVHALLPPQTWKILILCLAGGKCENCGAESYLQCHHIDRHKGHNYLANGMCLCSDCHHKWHDTYNNRDIRAVVNDRLMYLMSLSENHSECE